MTELNYQEVDQKRVADAVYNSTSMELTTSRDGRPITFPVTPYLDPESNRIVTSSPLAYSEKLDRIRENKSVSMRFYQGDDHVMIRGEADIREDLDPWEASSYLMDLTFKQRPTDKARFFEYVADSLTSRYGEWMRDWYRLRRVIEIEPEEIADLGEPVSLEAVSGWREAGMAEKEANHYTWASLGVMDTGDDPLTLPIKELSVRDGVGYLDMPHIDEVEMGSPVCILLHWHSFELRDLGQRMIRGTVTGKDEEVEVSAGDSYSHWNESLLDDIVFNLRGKRKTAKQLGIRNPLRWRW